MDDNLYKVLTLALGTVSTIGIPLIAYLTVRANQAAAAANLAAAQAATKATVAVREVKQTLAATTGDTNAALATIAQVTDATHVLVNSNMQAQLEISAAALRRIADLTSDPADRTLANNAHELLEQHKARQVIVDRSHKP